MNDLELVILVWTLTPLVTILLSSLSPQDNGQEEQEEASLLKLGDRLAHQPDGLSALPKIELANVHARSNPDKASTGQQLRANYGPNSSLTRWRSFNLRRVSIYRY